MSGSFSAPLTLENLSAAGGDVVLAATVWPVGAGELGVSGLVDGVAVAGVVVTALEAHHDARGSFTEVYAVERDHTLSPTQWSIVRSEAGALRGMHFHRRHDEFLTIVSGRLFVGLHDLRPDSPTAGAGALYVLDAVSPASIAFPRGLVHGWMADGPVVHLQAVSESYSTYGSDDNEGCRWDDPALGIRWPAAPRFVSSRADAFGSLEDLRTSAFARPRV